MSLPFKIALRYFRSRNKRSFISIIATIAMVGVGVGAMAMVVVLSVFNGMEELNRKIFKSFEADITVLPAKGRRFDMSSDLLQKVNRVEGVKYVTQVLEDNALARYGDQQTIVKVKGVDSTYSLRGQLDSAMVEGGFSLRGGLGTPQGAVSAGIRQALTISLRDIMIPLELWYPKPGKKTLNLNSTDAFNSVALRPSGVFFIESKYDDYVIVPLQEACELMGTPEQRTSLEIELSSIGDMKSVQKELKTLLGERFKVLNQDEMNEDLLRAIRIEKLFALVTLSLIILVAAINIFFSLSMLVLEKKKDLAILNAMGASPGLIRKIFLYEGVIVSFSGALIGLVAGVIICFVQEQFGIVSMGMISSLVDSYPVQLRTGDLFLTAVIIILITILVSLIPAIRAGKAVELVAD